MISAIAIDDEPPALRVIQTFCMNNDSVHLLKTFTNTDEALDFIRYNEVDILFLDIQMPTISGFDLYKKLPRNIPVIFTTAYAEYAVDAFDMEAIDYLLKPFSKQRFDQAIAKALLMRQKNTAAENYLMVRIDYSIQRINCDHILCMEALDDYVRFHIHQQKPLVVRQTLKSLLEKLPSDNFIRVHRSYIVALNKIKKIKDKTIFIQDLEIPVSNTYENDFNQKYTALK